MNRIKSLFFLSLMLIMSGQVMAQTSGTMFLGASLPMKDFADFDGFDDFALTSTDEDGGAAVGFNAGLKWYFNVGVKGLGVMLSVDGFYNGPNADLKDAYRNNEGSSSIFGELIGDSFSYTYIPKYINVPAMLGLNYTYHINPNFGVYVEAGAGGNVRFITDMQHVAEGHLLTNNVLIKTTQSYDKAFTFAYQAGAGIEVAKNFVIGCSFYNLGTAQVKGDQTVKTITNGGTPAVETSYKEMGTIESMMVLGRIGFKF